MQVAGCSVTVACQALSRSRRWLYYRPQPWRGRLGRRPEVEDAIRRLLGTSPVSYGYRRIHALLKRRGLVCNPKTVWRVMRRQGWLSTSRKRQGV